MRKTLTGARYILIVATIALPAVSQAQGLLPGSINHQGTLVNANGEPLADGPYDLEFSIYDQRTGGTVIWGPQEFLDVPVVNGRYNVALGPMDSTARQISTAFDGTSSDNDSRFVEVTVDGAPVGTKQQILAAPYALATFGMVPIGCIIAHHIDQTGAASLSALADSGFAVCDGTTPESQGITGAVITAALPNLNVGEGTGYFLRGTTGISGATQEDQMQGHFHSASDHTHTTTADPHTHIFTPSNHAHPIDAGQSSDGFRAGDGDGDMHTATTEDAISGLTFDNTAVSIKVEEASVVAGGPTEGNNGAPRIGDETRPKSATVLWIMRVR